jgi:hypothetical protein
MARDGTNAIDVFAVIGDFTADYSIEEPNSFVPLVKRPPLED